MDDETMGNQQGTLDVSEAEKGWAGGIIDGEGSVILFLGVRKGGKINNMSPQVIVGNTDFGLLERYVDILQRLNVGLNVTTRLPRYQTGVQGSVKSKVAYKPLKVASVVGFKRVKTLLDSLTPYLYSEKRQKAELLLQFIDRRLSRSVSNGKYSNTPYDYEDLRIVWQICQMMKSKHAHLIEGLLRDYERPRELLRA